MKITLEQRGGYAGIAIKRQVDTAEVAEAEALVVQAEVFTLSEAALPPARGADMQSYLLTVVDGERKRAVHLRDGQIPDQVRPLMDFMKKRPPLH